MDVGSPVVAGGEERDALQVRRAGDPLEGFGVSPASFGPDLAAVEAHGLLVTLEYCRSDAREATSDGGARVAHRLTIEVGAARGGGR